MIHPPQVRSLPSLPVPVRGIRVFSVKAREPVLDMDSRSQVTWLQEDGVDCQIFVQEAEAIVRRLRRDGVIGRWSGVRPLRGRERE